jgi:hypothetical protein
MMSWSVSGTLSGRRNGCSNQQIVRLSIHQRVAPPPEKPTYVALLPFVSTTLNRISQMLSRHNIKYLDLTLRFTAFFSP